MTDANGMIAYTCDAQDLPISKATPGELLPI